MPRKIIFDSRQSPGDTLAGTAAIKALHQSQPGLFLTDHIGHNARYSGGNNLFANNPLMTEIFTGDINNRPEHQCGGAQYVKLDYGYGIQNAGRSYHFIHAFAEHLEHILGVHIELKDFKGDLYLSEEERQPWPGLPDKFIYLNAGRKSDFTAKLFSTHRFQKVVDDLHNRITFVQVGSPSDYHPRLNNTIYLADQNLSLRDTIRIMYGASLCITANSYPMHLAAAVPTPTGDIRPCIVLAGRREQAVWFRYPGHTALGTEGKLACGIGNGCACWFSKVTAIPGDRDKSICRNAILDEAGQPLPECLHRVTAADIIRSVEGYLGI